MKQCPNCGKDCSEGQSFCSGCGTALTEAPPPRPAPEEPTILIPPARPQPGPVPAGDPFAGNGPQPPAHASAPARQSRASVFLTVALAVCAVLAAVCAGFAGVRASQYRKSCELEREEHLAAVQEAARIQEELDKLQLDRDKTTEQLRDLGLQLEDVSGQLTDGSSRLEKAEEELSALIGLLSGELGYASPEFCSTRDVVVVRKGSSVTVPVYIEPVDGAVYTLDCSGAGDAVSCQWGVESIVRGENPVTVTGSEEGCYVLNVRNDAGYGSSFRILVIVTE